MPRRLTALLLCLITLLPCLASADVEALSPLDAYVDEAFRGAKTVGGSLVIMKDGQIVYARDYGLKDKARSLPVDENTYFRTASITKMITGVGLMRLVDMGLLDLDADIGTYLGYPVANGRYPDVPVTLRQLMSHTSSLTDVGSYGGGSKTLSQLIGAGKQQNGNYRKARPGSQYEYTNFGAGVTGALIEAVTGMSVDSYMKSAVFEPLGLTATYTASLIENPADVSNQYKDGKLNRSAGSAIAKKHENFADPEHHYRITIGDVWIRSRDMARLAALLCADGSQGGVRILSPESNLMMRQEQMTLGGSVTGESPYGLFMEHNDTLLKDRMVYGHQGMSAGAILNCYFEPESGFVMVLFSNGGSRTRMNRIGKLARKFFTHFYELYGREAQPSGPSANMGLNLTKKDGCFSVSPVLYCFSCQKQRLRS